MEQRVYVDGVPDPTVTMNAAAVLQVEKDAAGVQETLFLQNYGNALDQCRRRRVRIDFMENCKIEAVVDSVSTWHSSLRLFAATGYATPLSVYDSMALASDSLPWPRPLRPADGRRRNGGGNLHRNGESMINAMYTALRAYGLLT